MGDRKKIVVFPSWYTNEVVPLAGAFVQEYVKAAMRDHDMMVFFPYVVPVGVFLRRTHPWVEDHLENGIRTVRVRVPHVRKLWLLFYLPAAVLVFRRLMRQFKPDLIHSHVAMPAGFATAIISRIFRIPYIISEHTGPFSLLVPTRLHLAMARWAMQGARAILPVSKNLQAQIEQYGIHNTFYIVPNPVDTSIFYPASSNRTRKGLYRMLFVGGLSPEKNIPLLLEALAELRTRGENGFALDIVGDGNYRREYEALTIRLKLTDIVTFHGLKAKHEVAEFMRQCDFLVLPSKAETFGCVLVEAMACGKPVLATDQGGPSEIITPQTGTLVNVANIDTLAEAIASMASRLHTFRKEEIVSYAEKNFSLAAIGYTLNDIYRHVVV